MRLLWLILLTPLLGVSQNPSVIWKDHLPYNNVEGITLSSEKVYAHTKHAVFSIDLVTKETERLSKVEGLNEALISDIQYADSKEMLIVGYSNGNVDIVEGKSVRNVSGIKSSAVIGDKTIYDIFIWSDYAYICCGYGITRINLKTYQIEESYIIGNGGSNLRVNDLLIDRDTIFAATDLGLYYGDMNKNLIDHGQWVKDPFFVGHQTNLIGSLNGVPWVNIKEAAYNGDSAFQRVNGVWNKVIQTTSRNSWSMQGYNDGLLISHNNSFQLLDQNGAIVKDFFGQGPKEVLRDDRNHYWLASGYAGLIEIDTSMLIRQYFVPDGPATSNVMDIEITSEGVWVAPGGRNSSWNNFWRIDGLFHYQDADWNTVNGINHPELDTCYDFVKVKADPADPDHIFVGCWSRGLLEFDNDQLVTIHGPGNSTIQSRPELYWVGVGGIDFDAAGNMWVTNCYTSNPLQVRTTNGTWKSFNLGQTIQQTTAVGEVMVDDENYIWALASKDGRVAVYDHKGTILNETDDHWIGLSGLLGNGSIPGSYTSCLHLDKQGKVWLGTNDGLASCQSTAELFIGNMDLIVAQDKYNPGQRMLAYETINAIASDGGNLKWVATSNSGLYLLSPDCDIVLAHFTEENSPLFSNHVLTLKLDPTTGELFVGTAKGIMSLKFIASPNVAELDAPLVYPNPAPRNLMKVTGVPYGTRISIFDLQGRVVAEDINYSERTDYDIGKLLGPAHGKGLYFLKLSSSTGETGTTQKIIITQ